MKDYWVCKYNDYDEEFVFGVDSEIEDVKYYYFCSHPKNTKGILCPLETENEECPFENGVKDDKSI